MYASDTKLVFRQVLEGVSQVGQLRVVVLVLCHSQGLVSHTKTVPCLIGQYCKTSVKRTKKILCVTQTFLEVRVEGSQAIDVADNH